MVSIQKKNVVSNLPVLLTPWSVIDGHCGGEDDWTKMSLAIIIIFVLLIQPSHHQCPDKCLCSGVSNTTTLRCIWAGLKVIPSLAPIDAPFLITLYNKTFLMCYPYLDDPFGSFQRPKIQSNPANSSGLL